MMNVIETIHIITEPTRFRLLQLLFKHHYCVRALAKKLDITESAVSQHMRVLKKCQVVHGVKIGYQVHYQVDRKLISSLLEEISQQFSQYPIKTGTAEELDCSCEFISECIKRDSELPEAQEYGK